MTMPARILLLGADPRDVFYVRDVLRKLAVPFQVAYDSGPEDQPSIDTKQDWPLIQLHWTRAYENPQELLDAISSRVNELKVASTEH